MELTLAESVLLLERGNTKTHSITAIAAAAPIGSCLAGALLLDLGRLGALRHEGKEFHPVDGVEITDPMLTRAHTVISTLRKPRRAVGWVRGLEHNLQPILYAVASQLIERGILAEQWFKVLGLFHRAGFITVDPGPEQVLRTRLRDILLGARAPQEYDALLLGLLDDLRLVGSLVDRPQRREARTRAKQIADTGIPGSAVSGMAREVHTALRTVVSNLWMTHP